MSHAMVSSGNPHTSAVCLQVGKAGTGRGRKRKSGEQASTKDLQLAGILHIMFLLANDEVSACIAWTLLHILQNVTYGDCMCQTLVQDICMGGKVQRTPFDKDSTASTVTKGDS